MPACLFTLLARDVAVSQGKCWTTWGAFMVWINNLTISLMRIFAVREIGFTSQDQAYNTQDS